MTLVKLGKKGQVSIPVAVLREVGIEGEAPLLVETTDDGAIILRPAGVYPIELYSDDRIAEFLDEDRVPQDLADRLASTVAGSPEQPSDD